MNARPWHYRGAGPWYKRLRIALFGLTDKERAENEATLAAIRAKIASEHEEDERLLDKIHGPA